MKHESPKREAGPSPGKARPHPYEGRRSWSRSGRASAVGQGGAAATHSSVSQTEGQESTVGSPWLVPVCLEDIAGETRPCTTATEKVERFRMRKNGALTAPRGKQRNPLPGWNARGLQEP